MELLASSCRTLGFAAVRTYANSGNVVFDTTGRRAAIEAQIEATLERALGFEATTFVRSATRLRQILAAEPFEVETDDTYFVTLLKRSPTPDQIQALEAASNDFDTLVVIGDDVHWRMRGRSTETTVPAKVWNVLGPHATTSRNVTMLRKLAALVE